MTQINAITGTIAPMLRQRRIAVCVGAGGVGKSTLAAAMAVEAARAERQKAEEETVESCGYVRHFAVCRAPAA